MLLNLVVGFGGANLECERSLVIPHAKIEVVYLGPCQVFYLYLPQACCHGKVEGLVRWVGELESTLAKLRPHAHSNVCDLCGCQHLECVAARNLSTVSWTCPQMTWSLFGNLTRSPSFPNFRGLGYVPVKANVCVRGGLVYVLEKSMFMLVVDVAHCLKHTFASIFNFLCHFSF